VLAKIAKSAAKPDRVHPCIVISTKSNKNFSTMCLKFHVGDQFITQRRRPTKQYFLHSTNKILDINWG
jgi:hypothetical protein